MKPQFTKDEIRWLFMLVRSHWDDPTAIDPKAYKKMCRTVMQKMEELYATAK